LVFAALVVCGLKKLRETPNLSLNYQFWYSWFDSCQECNLCDEYGDEETIFS